MPAAKKQKKQRRSSSVRPPAEDPIAAVNYEVSDARTNILLLASPNPETVSTAFHTLNTYASQKVENTRVLYSQGVLPNLTNLLLSASSEPVILCLTLKILGLLVSRVPEARKELVLEDIERLATIFITNSDGNVKEFCSQILSKTIDSSEVASKILQTGIVAAVFEVLKTTIDPDLHKNSLEVLYQVMAAEEAQYVFPRLTEFSSKILICCAKSAVPEIRVISMDLLEKLVSWRSNDMQRLLKEEKIVENMLTAVMDKASKDFHDQAFRIILSCVNQEETESYFTKSLEFFQFCEWSATCSSGTLLDVATFFASLTKHEEVRQTLVDFSVEDSILTFFRSKDDRVLQKTCESVLHLMDHRYCCKKMLTPVILTTLLEILTRSCSETPLKVLYNFLRRDGRTARLITGINGLETLVELFVRGKLGCTGEGFVTLMNILYVLSVYDFVKPKILDRIFYTVLLKLFSGDEDDNISLAALNILNQYVDSGIAREYFLEHEGPSLVLNKVLHTTHEQLHRNCLVFMLRLIQYKAVGMAFLKIGSTRALNDIRADLKKAYPLIQKLVDAMYNLYLPKKFYELGKLAITDKLRDRFYVVQGKRSGSFPFLEILEEMKVCPRAVVYVIDFYRNELSKRQSLLSLNSNPRRRSSKASQKSKQKSETNDPPFNLGIKPEEKEPFQPPKVTYLRPVKIRYGKISPDPYLTEYANNLKTQIYSNPNGVLNLQERIEMIAKYVHCCLSGFKPGTHIAELHIATLKEKLGTSIIPLGFVRVGGYCEKALLFKALADQLAVPATLNRGSGNVYWNEVAVSTGDENDVCYLTYCVVDLMYDVGKLLVVGSEAANKYCNI